MQVKDLLSDTFGLFQDQLRKHPFELNTDEANAVLELDALYALNREHFFQLVQHRPDRALFDRCVEDFKKLQVKSLTSKSIKVAALGSVYISEIYSGYIDTHYDRLGDKRMNKLEALYKQSEVILLRYGKRSEEVSEEKRNAENMIETSFDRTNRHLVHQQQRTG